jgi:hypothetical protein
MYKLELYEKELNATAKGREILNIAMQHVEEINRLINHNREVMVTWKRNKGPEFFMQFMGSGFDQLAVVTKEMDGISLRSLIRRMVVVLQDNGSRDLVTAIDQHLLLVLEYTTTCHSLHQIFQKLREHEQN